MGMSVAEFERMLIGDFFLKLRYFFRDRANSEDKREALIRLQTLCLINIQLDKDSKINDARDLWKMACEMTPEELEELEKKAVKEEPVLVDEKEAIIGVTRLSKML